jgi:DNA polymerase-3 subunit beta
VGRGGNHLGFRSANQEVYTRLIEGSYPNYEQVIPKDNENVARVDREAMESAVRRMAVLASDQTHRIRLSFESDRVHLDVMTPDLGEAHDELELDYDGEALRIGFNAHYLIEVLRNMPAGDVELAFKTAERAATIVPAESELDYLCLVMPLRLVD